MEYRIEQLREKKLIGKRTTMSFAANTTPDLWKSFMPRRREIIHRVGDELYSVQVYPDMFFEKFNPQASFEKWAAMEVGAVQELLPGMETTILPAGLYAVFSYRGPAGSPAPFQYIFQTWLPASAYRLDTRPHFELLGAKYKNHDPDSEEEIWIPVRKRENRD
jgi:AraC family transcriptional regulator